MQILTSSFSFPHKCAIYLSIKISKSGTFKIFFVCFIFYFNIIYVVERNACPCLHKLGQPSLAAFWPDPCSWDCVLRFGPAQYHLFTKGIPKAWSHTHQQEIQLIRAVPKVPLTKLTPIHRSCVCQQMLWPSLMGSAISPGFVHANRYHNLINPWSLTAPIP